MMVVQVMLTTMMTITIQEISADGIHPIADIIFIAIFIVTLIGTLTLRLITLIIPVDFHFQ